MVGLLSRGIGGNPRRPKLTAEERDLIEACRKLTPQALERIRGLMDDADKDSVNLTPLLTSSIGWGKAPNVVEINATVTQLSHEESGWPALRNCKPNHEVKWR